MKREIDIIEKPLVSVVMPAYNVETYIREAIDSILNQTFVNFELIIADDGSKDKTLSIINSYHDPRMRVFSHPNNLGYVENMNFLFRQAKGEYIVIQDADDYCDTNRLMYLYDFLKNNSEISFVGSSYYKVDELGVNDLVVMPTDCELIKLTFDNMTYPLPVVNGCSMFRRKIIDEDVLFRNLKHVTRAQDDDWLFRISEKYKIANVSEPLYYYRNNQTSMTLNPANINSNNLWASEYVMLLKKSRTERGIDLLAQEHTVEISSFFENKRQALLKETPAFFELFTAGKFLGVSNRKEALKWFLRALFKDPFNAYIWKKIVWVVIH